MKFALVQLNNRNEAVFYKEVIITKKIGERLSHSWFGNPVQEAEYKQKNFVHCHMYLCGRIHHHNASHQELLRELFGELPAGIIDIAIIDL